jgi:hypothetical protein
LKPFNIGKAPEDYLAAAAAQLVEDSWIVGCPLTVVTCPECEGYDSFSRLTLYHHFALVQTNESQRHQSQAIPLLVQYYQLTVLLPPYPHEMSPQRHWSLSWAHTNPRTQRNPVLFLLALFTLILKRPGRRAHLDGPPGRLEHKSGISTGHNSQNMCRTSA